MTREDGAMTHPLLEFLNSCLNADESIANEVSGRYEESPGPGIWVHDDDYRHDSLMVTKRAVLAGVEAFRAILELHSPATHQAIRYGRPHGEPGLYCPTCLGGEPCECCPVNHPDNVWPCQTVRALVSALASREGYDPAWGPT